MIEGKQTRQAVKDVFDFFYYDPHLEDKQFFPESIYKGKTFEMATIRRRALRRHERQYRRRKNTSAGKLGDTDGHS
jgi:hypothetical protein